MVTAPREKLNSYGTRGEVENFEVSQLEAQKLDKVERESVDPSGKNIYPLKPVTGKNVECFQCGEEGPRKWFCPQYAKINRGNEKGDNSITKGLNGIYTYVNGISEEKGKMGLKTADFVIGGKKYSGFIDSNRGISVLRESIIPGKYFESKGKIRLRPATGPEIKAKLISVPVSLVTEEKEIHPVVRIQVAAVKNLNAIALITPRHYELLK